MSWKASLLSIALALSVTDAAAAQSSGGAADLFTPVWAARVARAEKWLPAAVRADLDGAPTQKRIGSGGPSMLDPLVEPAWSSDGRFYYWAPDRTLKLADPAARRLRTIIDTPQIEALLRSKGLSGQIAADVPPPVRLVEGRPLLTVMIDGRAVTLDVLARKVMPEKAGVVADESLSPDGRVALRVRDHNLFARGADGIERRVTTDASLWYSFDGRYARSNPVERSASTESRPRVLWLPGPAHRALVERWDFRKVAARWILDPLAQPMPDLVEQRMAAPGDVEIPVPEFWIVDLDQGQWRKVEAEGFAYVGNMDVGAGGFFPAPDGKSLYFTRMSRGYEVVELVRLDLASGARRVVLTERDPLGFGVRYPELGFIDVAGDDLVWKSDRGGRTAYWRLNARTGHLTALAAGDFTAEKILAIDPKAGRLVFTAFGDGQGGDPYYPHTFVAPLAGGAARRLDDVDAAHRADISPDKRFIIDTSSRLDLAPRAVVRDRTGAVVLDLGEANLGKLRARGWRAPQRVRVKAADGVTDLLAVIWTPTDFDASRRYPVITQVYPGPGNEKTPIAFAPDNAATALAELGFVVVQVGQRGGSPMRDRAYRTYARVQGSVRDYPLADNRAALIGLAASRPYMDLSRVAIMGESGGGFMAAAAILVYPKFYKAAVAASGNHDNRVYEMNSSEYFFGAPNAPGAARYDANQDLAGQLEGALMLVHGDQDEDVPMASTSRLVEALNRAGKRYEYLNLPSAGHFGFDRQTSDTYRRRIWRFLIDNLDPLPN